MIGAILLSPSLPIALPTPSLSLPRLIMMYTRTNLTTDRWLKNLPTDENSRFNPSRLYEIPYILLLG
jgi:hypothetical protein